MSQIQKYDPVVGVVPHDKDLYEKVKSYHTSISQEETPKKFVKKDYDGNDYVSIQYMRNKANEKFPGWSFLVVDTKISLESMSFIVHGRLIFNDNGLLRTGDWVASHRIQHKSGDKQSGTIGVNSFVNVGNDAKAAVSDCLKKCFNVYMNIADDVYKNQEEEPITEEERKTLLEKLSSPYLANSEGFKAKILGALDEGSIIKKNLQSTIDSIELRILKEKSKINSQ